MTLKPCQKEAMKTLAWCDPYFLPDISKAQLRCTKADRIAEVEFRIDMVDSFVISQAKRTLIMKLCDGCTCEKEDA